MINWSLKNLFPTDKELIIGRIRYTYITYILLLLTDRSPRNKFRYVCNKILFYLIFPKGSFNCFGWFLSSSHLLVPFHWFTSFYPFICRCLRWRSVRIIIRASSFIRKSLNRQLDHVFVLDPSEVTVSKIESLVVAEDQCHLTLELTICLPCVGTLFPLLS